MNKKKVLVIAPLPPPMTGAAYISQEIIKKLETLSEVIEIGLQRGNLQSGSFSILQSLRVIYIGLRVLLLRFNPTQIDCVYMVISTSSWGNYRDLFILLCLGSHLRSKTTIHSHGGNWDLMIGSKPTILKSINKYFLKNIKSNIILGEYFLKMFNNYVYNKDVIQKNFYGNVNQLITDIELIEKFKKTNPVRILFLSNLIPEKGYLDLLNVFLSLSDEVSKDLQLDFAGTFKYEKDEIFFIDKIKDKANIFYHGHVTGELKENLLKQAHLFCLPTKFIYEGQPVTILEAYSKGCIVATTNNGGISNIFKNGINGIGINFLIKNIDENRISIDESSLKSILLNISEFIKFNGFKTAKNNIEYVKKNHDYDEYMINICSIILN